ncbi:hypothetical protein LXL04_021571 [Taraxacum kok-saghyz]
MSIYVTKKKVNVFHRQILILQTMQLPPLEMSETPEKKNKRKFTASEEVTKIIEKGFATVTEEMQKMTKVIMSSTNDLAELKTVHEELKTMDLSSTQIMRVCLKFTKNLNLLSMWNSLDAATKPVFAKTILEDDN